MVIMRKHFHRVTQLFLGFILATSSCAQVAAESDNDPIPQNAAWIALSITNGKAVGTLNLIAGQEYIFDRITLAVDSRSAKDSLDALDWLRHQSSFNVLNWDGVRETGDKNPQGPYDFPIRLIQSPFNYGGRLEVKVEPDKPIYYPGDTLRATFTLRDQKGVPLKFSEFDKNGIRQINIHLDGPVQNPTYYHEEWLSEFRQRYAHHVRAPALGFGMETESTSTPLPGPPLDPSGTQMVVELQVPKNLPKEQFGSFEIGATAWRNFASQSWIARLDKPIQVGQKEHTEFERFGCKNCHVPETPMELGLLIPPMVGVQKLQVDSIESCVMCHDNSRNGSRRLD